MRFTTCTLDEFFLAALRHVAMNGVRIECVLDRGAAEHPHTTGQIPAMNLLRGLGTRMFKRRPARGNAMSIQHEKTWLLDDALLVVSSMSAMKNFGGAVRAKIKKDRIR